MLDTLLFPTDGSDGADRMLEHVLDVASAHDASVHVLNVADANRTSVASTESGKVDVLVTEGEAIVEAAAERARERGVSARDVVIRGEPYSTITEHATDHGVDLVAMPTRGRGAIGQFLLGSVATKVVRTADVPVLTARPEATFEYPIEDVLVATDGSDTADAAVREAAAFAAAEGATLHAVSIVPIATYGVDAYSTVGLADLEERAEAAVEAAAEVGRELGVEVTTTVETASIHRGLLNAVDDHGADLLAVGTHGRTGFDRYLLGSVTEKLLRTAPVPVLTVREAEEAGS